MLFAGSLALLGVVASPGATLGASAAAVTVHIRGFAFVPSMVRVVSGTVVRFVNDDSEAHTVTSTNRSFDSGGLDTGDVWNHTFSKAGTFSYFCALHPYMKGSVVVVKGSVL
jgi:plastocyanin